jgi:hypothetical protein
MNNVLFIDILDHRPKRFQTVYEELSYPYKYTLEDLTSLGCIVHL